MTKQGAHESVSCCFVTSVYQIMGNVLSGFFIEYGVRIKYNSNIVYRVDILIGRCGDMDAHRYRKQERHEKCKDFVFYDFFSPFKIYFTVASSGALNLYSYVSV